VTFDHPSVAALVEHLAAVAFATELGTPVETAPTASALDELSDAELARRLAEALEDTEGA
jgi:hypothetical protein